MIASWLTLKGNNMEYEDWIENEVNNLMAEDGECYPFKPANFQEAIAELDLTSRILMAAYAHVVAKTPNESTNRNFSEYMVKIAREYWARMAKAPAEHNWERYTYSLDKEK